jgi:hypothetical protein
MTYKISPFGRDDNLSMRHYTRIQNMGGDSSILKLAGHDEERELEFELAYLRSLTFKERLTMMRRKSKEMLQQMVNLGYRRPFEIVKRP